MPNLEAATVTKIIMEEVVARFGVPNEIHSDQGRQYESKIFSEMYRLLHIHKFRTTPYHPKSDCMVEQPLVLCSVHMCKTITKIGMCIYHTS